MHSLFILVSLVFIFSLQSCGLIPSKKNQITNPQQTTNGDLKTQLQGHWKMKDVEMGHKYIYGDTADMMVMGIYTFKIKGADSTILWTPIERGIFFKNKILKISSKELILGQTIDGYGQYGEFVKE